MAVYTFTPSGSVPNSILKARSTIAKVQFDPMQVFVEATLIAPSSIDDYGEDHGENESWKVVVEDVPWQKQPSAGSPHAFLHLTKGELGKYLGMVDLGAVDLRRP